jgi:glycosyltransferase involved in cell wall biosynthesis
VRILDLGSHDFYVSTWLARQLKAKGIEAHIDGIELHPGAVSIAQRRIDEEEIEGKVVCGDALNAAEHFDAGTYDAVVLFELIEHVPEPQALLEAAERMCKPDGRVYVSTPNGTFGEGNNPHHLRVYRAHDLADALRRRGQLEDMVVGEDGVTVAAYTPAERRGEIAIYTGPGWEPFSPHDVELKGLGGSETAAIRLAQHLSELGYVVTVYGEVEQCAFRDTIFRHHSVFDPMERREAVIVSRIPEIFDRRVNARTRMLWLHDTDAQDRLTGARADAIDHVLCLSRWHATHVKGMYPFLSDKIRRIRNGLELAYFNGAQPHRERRVVYSSSPDRGLDVLLEIWPRIRELVPDAELSWAYSAVYDKVAEQRPEIAEHRQLVARLSEQPGVTALGSLPQPELAKVMRASLVWAHPSYATPYGGPFHETSCIGAMEAQAAGCLVVASGWGALPETVEVGRLVDSEPLSDRWRDGFVKCIAEGLTDRKVQRWAQSAGPEAAKKLTWDGVARQVAGLVEGEAFAYAKTTA